MAQFSAAPAVGRPTLVIYGAETRQVPVGGALELAGDFAVRDPDTGVPAQPVEVLVDGEPAEGLSFTDLFGEYEISTTFDEPGIFEVQTIADRSSDPLETVSDQTITVQVGTALLVTVGGPGSGRVTSDQAGIDCGDDCDHLYPEGELITLTATPDMDTSFFSGWSGDCSGMGECTVSMDQARSVGASFDLIPRTLTFTKAGPGVGSVTSSPSGISCTTNCSGAFPHGTAVTLTATPDPTSSTFAGWSGACSGVGSCSVTMNSDVSVTATFNLIPRTLSVTKGGAGSGTVTSSPSGINCGSACSAGFGHGTSVTLTASPVSHSYLSSWSGSCSGSSATCVVSMTANRSVTANFARKVLIRKGVSAQGQPGCGSSACRWIDVSVSRMPANTTVTIVCRAEDWPGGFWTYTRTTNGSGSSGGWWLGHTTGGCYYGYPNTSVWVTVNGLASATMTW